MIYVHYTLYRPILLTLFLLVCAHLCFYVTMLFALVGDKYLGRIKRNVDTIGLLNVKYHKVDGWHLRLTPIHLVDIRCKALFVWLVCDSVASAGVDKPLDANNYILAIFIFIHRTGSNQQYKQKKMEEKLNYDTQTDSQTCNEYVISVSY